MAIRLTRESYVALERAVTARNEQRAQRDANAKPIDATHVAKAFTDAVTNVFPDLGVDVALNVEPTDVLAVHATGPGRARILADAHQWATSFEGEPSYLPYAAAVRTMRAIEPQIRSARETASETRRQRDELLASLTDAQRTLLGL